jgi:hypothetical protein
LSSAVFTATKSNQTQDTKAVHANNPEMSKEKINEEIIKITKDIVVKAKIVQILYKQAREAENAVEVALTELEYKNAINEEAKIVVKEKIEAVKKATDVMEAMKKANAEDEILLQAMKEVSTALHVLSEANSNQLLAKHATKEAEIIAMEKMQILKVLNEEHKKQCSF